MLRKEREERKRVILVKHDGKLFFFMDLLLGLYN